VGLLAECEVLRGDRQRRFQGARRPADEQPDVGDSHLEQPCAEPVFPRSQHSGDVRGQAAVDGTAAQIRLIVPILVIEELDDLLHNRNGDRRLKARNATRALRDLHHARPTEPAALPAQPGVTIEVLLDGDWHQRRPNNDAEIIDQALSVREMTGRPTLLATCDIRQLCRAGAVSLQAVLMPRAGEA
jgi:hypothetical protein